MEIKTWCESWRNNPWAVKTILSARFDTDYISNMNYSTINLANFLHGKQAIESIVNEANRPWYVVNFHRLSGLLTVPTILKFHLKLSCQVREMFLYLNLVLLTPVQYKTRQRVSLQWSATGGWCQAGRTRTQNCRQPQSAKVPFLTGTYSW